MVVEGFSSPRVQVPSLESSSSAYSAYAALLGKRCFRFLHESWSPADISNVRQEYAQKFLIGGFPSTVMFRD